MLTIRAGAAAELRQPYPPNRRGPRVTVLRTFRKRRQHFAIVRHLDGDVTSYPLDLLRAA